MLTVNCNWKIRLKCVVWLTISNCFESLFLGNWGSSTYDKWYRNILIQSKHIGHVTQVAKFGGMQGLVLLFKGVTLWDWKMAISPSSSFLCLHVFICTCPISPKCLSPPKQNHCCFITLVHSFFREHDMQYLGVMAWLHCKNRSFYLSEIWTRTVKWFWLW